MTDLAVIMSVYKNDKLKFLKESVQSILNQTFSKFHYYLIFDGPVASEIDSYISSLKDNRIKLFRLERNGGLAGALNYLLDIVLKDPDYKIIARMDADDISVPTRFEKQYNFLSVDNDISCVGCWYQEIDESGKHLADRKLPTEHKALKKRYYTRTPFAHPSVMYKRQLIEKSGNYPTDTVLMEDNVLWGKALKQGLQFANIPEFLFKFRIDRDFYRRRSGLKYGWNFIRNRMNSFKMLGVPVQFYFFSVGSGLLRMLPSSLVKMFYQLLQR